MPPKVLFGPKFSYNWISEEEINFGKLLFNNGKINRVPLLTRVDVWTNKGGCVDQPGWLCGPTGVDVWTNKGQE